MDTLLLQFEILWPALIGGLFILMTHIPLGFEVFKRGIIFLDLAVAQMAAFGVVLAHTLAGGSLPTTLVAVASAVLGSLMLYGLKHRSIKEQEALIGICFVLAATGCLLLLSNDPHGGERLKTLLVGQILWLTPEELWPLGLANGTILGLWLAFNARLGAWFFYPLFAIAITLATQVVGVYLVFASLIIPALACQWVRMPKAWAWLMGALGYGLGLVLAAYMDWPAGATLVWSLCVMAWVVALGYRWVKKRGSRIATGPVNGL